MLPVNHAHGFFDLSRDFSEGSTGLVFAGLASRLRPRNVYTHSLILNTYIPNHSGGCSVGIRRTLHPQNTINTSPIY